MRLDDWPFLAHGARGALAFGLLTHATGDGERMAWTVLPPLGAVELRPGPQGARGPYPSRPTDADRALVERLEALACEGYAAALNVHLPDLGKRWRVRTEGQGYSWSTPIKRAEGAYYGDHYCTGRLDLPIHDAARARKLHAFHGLSCEFGMVVWDWPAPHAWAQAERIGAFAAHFPAVFGEAGWDRIEAMIKGAP